MEIKKITRALTVVLGLLVGLGVYSYGMFHHLPPTWLDAVNVANCGGNPGEIYQAGEAATLAEQDSTLCEVTPGRWMKTPYGDGPFFLALGIAFGSALIALHRSSFLKWGTRSARGSVTLFLLLFGIPMMLLGLHLNFIEGTLTLDWALHVAFYAALSGAVMGILMWYTVVRPLRAKRSAANRSNAP